MKVLLVHNHYQQPGGEDRVFSTEASLLERHGHQVFRYTDHNDRLEELRTLETGVSTLWNRDSHAAVRELIRREGVDIAHVHNTFPLISPSVYYAAAREGIPVVQTLHNYRFVCPQSDFIRDGRICEDCLGKTIPWPGFVHACYRDSYSASGGAVAMLSLHRLIGTYASKISAYIALTEFGKRKFIEGGLPADRIFVKPNFVHPDPGPGEGKGGYALYVGRLSDSKGIETMLAAWRGLAGNVPLRIVGDGPLAGTVEESVARMPEVEWLGRRTWEEVVSLMQDAMVLVFPSEWYEGFPLVIAEAFATGLPVVTSRLGAMASIVEDHRTGIHFRARDPEDLAQKMRWIVSNAEKVISMRSMARSEFEAKYTAPQNYDLLMEIYGKVMEGSADASRGRVHERQR